MKSKGIGLICATAALSVATVGCVGYKSESLRREDAKTSPYWSYEAIPEWCLRQTDAAERLLVRIRRPDLDLSEEDLLACQIRLIDGEDSFCRRSSSGERSKLRKDLFAAIESHPNWTRRYDAWLRKLAGWVLRKDYEWRQSFLAEHFGLTEQDVIGKAEYAHDGSWVDWLRPSSDDSRHDLLTWEKASSSDIQGVGWFKEDPNYELPFKGRVFCLLKSCRDTGRTRAFGRKDMYGVIFKFDTEAEVAEALVVLYGGFDPREYFMFPRMFAPEGVETPPCTIMTYADDVERLYLVAVSEFWTWDRSSWHYLSPSVVPPRKEEGK